MNNFSSYLQVWIGVVFTTMLLIAVYWCSSRMQIRPMKISLVEVTLHIFGLLMGQRESLVLARR